MAEVDITKVRSLKIGGYKLRGRAWLPLWRCLHRLGFRVRDLFGRLRQDFENWRTEASEVFAAGDRVFALGTYSGAPR